MNSIKPKENKNKIKKKQKERKIQTSVWMPESLHKNLKEYVKAYGKSGESKNEILVAGAMAELQRRLSKAGKNVDMDTKINNIIVKIKTLIKEIDGLK